MLSCFSKLLVALHRAPPPDDPLKKIILKSLANDLVFSQTDIDTPLQDVLKLMVDKNRYRIIVVDADKKFVDLIYRINAAAFLEQPAGQAQPDPQPQPEPQAQAQAQAQAQPDPQTSSLKQYLVWRNAQGEQAQPKVVFLPENATLADADAKLKDLPGCRDAVVTSDGQPSSPVVVYVTDNDINEFR